jgi:hypothetical protein
MTGRIAIALAMQLFGPAGMFAQPAGNRSVVGTVSGLRAGSSEIEVRPDQGDAVLVKFGPDTLFQRVAPGEKDLKKAESIAAAGLAAGDRVLVSFVPGSSEARRIVVMPAADIEKRRQAERRDWIERGMFGVVASVKGSDITLRKRSFQGDVISTVTAGENTVFRRYQPGSVRFSDATISSLSEIRPGDQLRARGQTSADGLKLAAEEVVFGTFSTKAGVITAIHAAAGQIAVKDLQTNKALTVKLAAESQIKRMPQFPAMPGGAFPGGPPGGGRGAWAASTGAGAPPDFAQIIERMPAATLDDLKAGETVVFSTSSVASGNPVTAIMLLANAERLIQMASMQSRSGPQGDANLPGAAGMGGTFGSAAGLELMGMIP